MGRAKRGSFANLPCEALLTSAFKGLLQKTGCDPNLVEDVAIGNCLQGGSGGVTSRAAGFLAGLPITCTGQAINRQCSSGLQAVAHIANSIRAGEIEIGIGGGVENMSMYPMTAQVDPEKIWQPVFEHPLAQ